MFRTLLCGPRTCPGKPDTQKQHKPLRQSDQQDLELHKIETAPSLTVFTKKKKSGLFLSLMFAICLFSQGAHILYMKYSTVFSYREGKMPGVGPTPLWHNGQHTWHISCLGVPQLTPKASTHLKRCWHRFSIFLSNVLNYLHGFCIFVLGDQPSWRFGYTPRV